MSGGMDRALVERVAEALSQNEHRAPLAEVGDFLADNHLARAQAALDACHAEEAIDLLRSFVQHCPESPLISMGFDSPPEYTTGVDHQLAYTLHLARALLAKLGGRS